MKTILMFGAIVVLLMGCVSYSAVSPGESDHGGLRIRTSQAWNQAPKEATPAARSGSIVWTQDGILLDRVMIIPGVPSGEPIFAGNSGQQALPEFKADMLPNEIEELIESSVAKLFGEGDVAVGTSDLRPHRYGENDGFLFNMTVAVSDGPNYKGVTGAFVVAERLYLVIYLAAEPYYYEKHLDEAMVIIKGARV